MGWEPHPTGVVRKGQSGSSAAYKSAACEQLGRAEGVVVVVVPGVCLPASQGAAFCPCRGWGLFPREKGR